MKIYEMQMKSVVICFPFKRKALYYKCNSQMALTFTQTVRDEKVSKGTVLLKLLKNRKLILQKIPSRWKINSYDTIYTPGRMIK